MKDLIASNKILIIILFIFTVIFTAGEYSRTGDFYIYYVASSFLFSNTDIYNQLYGTPPLFEYYGSPFLTLLLYPFTYIPLPVAALLWKLLNIIILFRTWKLIEKHLDLTALNSRNYKLWVGASFAAASFPIYTNFHSLQLTFIILYCVLEGLHAIGNKKQLLPGAIIIATGILIKIAPFVTIPYLVYRRHFKAALGVGIVLVLLAITPSLFLGWEKNAALWSGWFNQINPQSEVNTYDMNNSKNHGLSAFITALFIKGINHSESPLHIRRHIVDLSPETVKSIILAARLSFIGFMLYFLRSLPFKRQQNKLHQFWEISYLLLVIPLLLPQQRPYNFILLWPAIAYSLYYLIVCMQSKKHNAAWKLYLLIFGLVVFNLELFIGAFREYYWHFKTLTYSTFIIFIVLTMLIPEKLNANKVND